MRNILITISILFLTGCATDLYVRDIHCKPVKNAQVQPFYYSVAVNETRLTDENGYVDISSFPLTPEGVKVVKKGYRTVIINQLEQIGKPPYIIVLIPEKRILQDNKINPADARPRR